MVDKSKVLEYLAKCNDTITRLDAHINEDNIRSCTKATLEVKRAHWQREAFAAIDELARLDEQTRIAEGLEYSNNN